MIMIWHLLHIPTLKSEYFKSLSRLISANGFTESTVRNKWAKEKKTNPNEFEIFIVIGNYRINKVKVN